MRKNIFYKISENGIIEKSENGINKKSKKIYFPKS